MRALFVLAVVLAAVSPRIAVAQALDPDEEAARRQSELRRAQPSIRHVVFDLTPETA